MKIPRELADLFEKYIQKNPELGYRKVSQYVLHLLQDKARELLGNNLEIKPKNKKTIELETGKYTKEDLQKLLNNIGD